MKKLKDFQGQQLNKVMMSMVKGGGACGTGFIDYACTITYAASGDYPAHSFSGIACGKQGSLNSMLSTMATMYPDASYACAAM